MPVHLSSIQPISSHTGGMNGNRVSGVSMMTFSAIE